MIFQPLGKSLPIHKDGAVAIRLIICPNHVLLHNGVRILNTCGDALFVDVVLGKVVICLPVTVSGVDKHVRDKIRTVHLI
jgi:hypothetical protein